MKKQFESLDVHLELNPSDILKTVELELKMRGYQPQVYVDEFIAYLIESPFDFGKKSASLLKPLHLQLRNRIPRPVFPL